MKDKCAILESLCENQPCEHGKGYCILKEMVLHDAKYNARLLAQFYCVNRFKYEQSDQVKRDVGWSAWLTWKDMGYAERFAEVFAEDLPLDELYAKVLSASSNKQI